MGTSRQRRRQQESSTPEDQISVEYRSGQSNRDRLGQMERAANLPSLPASNRERANMIGANRAYSRSPDIVQNTDNEELALRATRIRTQIENEIELLESRNSQPELLADRRRVLREIQQAERAQDASALERIGREHALERMMSTASPGERANSRISDGDRVTTSFEPNESGGIQEQEIRSDNGGIRESRTTRDTSSYNMMNGEYNRSRTNTSRLEEVNGSSFGSEESIQQTVSINNGIQGQSTITEERSGVSSSARSESRRTGRVLIEEGAHGFGLGNRDEITSSQGNTSRTTSSEEIVQVRENGASYQHRSGDSLRSGNYTGGVQTSADGSFTVDVEPIPGQQTYRVTITIHLGASVGVSSGRQRQDRQGVRLNAGLNASASGDVVMRRNLSREDSLRYLELAEQGSQGTTLPGLGPISRLRAREENMDQMSNMAALVSPEAAARMSSGEEVSLQLQGGVSGSGTAGLNHSGVDASISHEQSMTWRRNVTVSRSRDGNLVVLQIQFGNTHEEETGGSISARSMSGRTSSSQNNTNDTTRTFHLDPNHNAYADVMRRITSAGTPSVLQSLMRDRAIQDCLVRTTNTTGETEDSSTGMSVFGFGLGENRQERYQENLDENQGNTTLNVQGSRGGTLAITHGSGDNETTIARGGRTGSASMTANAEGVHGEIGETETTTSPLRAARESAADSFHETEDTIATIFARSPMDALRRVLGEDFQHFRGFQLDPSDFVQIRRRARDERRWGRCCTDPRILTLWSQFRRGLVNPPIRESEREISPSFAMQAGIARVMANVYRQGGTRIVRSMNNVLRRWGEAGSAPSRAEQLGSAVEWPAELQGARQRFTATMRSVRDFEQNDALLTNLSNAERKATELRGTLRMIISRVRSCETIENEGARTEMIEHIQGYLSRITRRLTAIRQSIARPEESENHSNTNSETITSEESSNAESYEMITRITGELPNFHRREQVLLNRANRLSYEGFDGRADSVILCQQIAEMHRSWYRQIQLLIQHYRIIGVNPRTQTLYTGHVGGKRNRWPDLRYLSVVYERANQVGFPARTIRAWQSRARRAGHPDT